MSTVKIEGLDECLRAFDKADANMFKVSKDAMKAGNKAVTKQMRATAPKRWRKLIKAKVYRLPNGKLAARAGLYNSGQSGGHQNKSANGAIPDWFKAYWANYGTLSRRDPNHRFDYPVKSAKKVTSKQARMKGQSVKYRRNDSGQPAQHFFENAISGWEDKFIRAYKDSIKQNEDKLLKG